MSRSPVMTLDVFNLCAPTGTGGAVEGEPIDVGSGGVVCIDLACCFLTAAAAIGLVFMAGTVLAVGVRTCV